MTKIRTFTAYNVVHRSPRQDNEPEIVQSRTAETCEVAVAPDVDITATMKARYIEMRLGWPVWVWLLSARRRIQIHSQPDPRSSGILEIRRVAIPFIQTEA